MEDVQPAGMAAAETRWRALCRNGMRGRDVVLLARTAAQVQPLLMNGPWCTDAEVQCDAAPSVTVQLLADLDMDQPLSDQVQRYVSLPVRVAEPGLRLEPGRLHIVSNPELSLQHRRFQFRPLVQGSRWAGCSALDRWLDALAQDLRERALVLWLDPLRVPPDGLRRVLSAGGEVFCVPGKHSQADVGLSCGHQLSVQTLLAGRDGDPLAVEVAERQAAAALPVGDALIAKLESPAERLLDAVPQALILLDAQLCVRWFNAQATHYFHLLPEDRGCPLTHVSSILVVDELGALLQRVLQQAVPCEKRIDHRSGRSDWLRLQPWFGDDGQRGVLLSLIDLSTLPALPGPQRLGESDIAEFAYAVSHDLQEPVRMIVGFAELLQRRHAQNLPVDEDAQRFMQLIRDGSRRVRTMLDAMLAYSRVDSRCASMVDVALDDVVAEVCQRWQSVLEPDGSRIELATLPRVHGDRAQLQWLFDEIIANAIKFRRPQALRITIDAEPEINGFWRLRVADNGSGIPMARAEQAFLMFKRLHARPELAGVGAGLSIVARIIHRHGGEVRFEPGVDEGCCINFTLPMAVGGASMTPSAEPRFAVSTTGEGGERRRTVEGLPLAELSNVSQP